MGASPYQTLESLTVELNRLAKLGDWEAAARVAGQLSLALPPRAQPADRAAIEVALHNMSMVSEQAEALRDDISKLLNGLSVGQKT